MTGPVILVAGARPNFVKVAPVLRALEFVGVPCSLVHTGQHYDTAMSQVFFDELGIRVPDHSLNVGSGTHADQTAAVMRAFDPVIEMVRPSAVVVFGDVNSTVACALVAAKRGTYVVHVEAGLRSRDWAMPEEVNRVVTDRLSDLLLCPSHDAAANVLAEGSAEHRVRVVGNVMIDTLYQNLDRALERRPIPNTDRDYALITLHRPSNVDDQRSLTQLVQVLGRLSKSIPVIWPVHPRTRRSLADISLPVGLHLCEPLGYLDFVALEAKACLVLTDSGGVQEETTALGVPCLTLRSSTERPITITEGTNRLVGTDPESILRAASDFLESPPQARKPDLWDGKASERCAQGIVELLGNSNWPRPTALDRTELQI